MHVYRTAKKQVNLYGDTILRIVIEVISPWISGRYLS